MGDNLPVAPREFPENPEDMPTEENFKLFERAVERDQRFKNEYTEYNDEFQCFYEVEEFLDFPNYRYLINLFKNKYSVLNENGRQLPITRNSILAELNRMEADGQIMISTQEGEVYANPAGRGHGPENEGKIVCEKIILTTKGKSNWGYFKHKLFENPVTMTISLFALVVSIISIFI